MQAAAPLDQPGTVSEATVLAIRADLGDETASTSGVMGEPVAQQNIERDRTNRKRPSKQTAAAIGHKLLEIIVYRKTCRIGDKLRVDDLVESSEVGDWKMPDFKMACTYAASQGWLIVEDDGLTLTTAGLAAA